jgi:ABC-type Fe3+/spermidine/putrescine transport system ATPase subunit
MPFLDVTAVHKTYENAPLLSGVSFSVERGQIAGLLGPSGSGKTTLLRIIAGLEPPERGTVSLEGQPLTDVPAHRRGIVLMFQEYALFPHKTVAENVAFGLEMEERGSDRIAARVQEMLELVGLEGFGGRDVHDLSGGERQRVALARSLAPQPRLLLLDEPLGALDRNLRERLMEELPAILRRVGVTTITVTHDQEEGFAMADRILLLHEGHVVQAGTPEAVYRAPVSTWAARFLGLRNLVAAEITGPREVRTPLGPLTTAEGVELPAPGTEGTLLIHPWGIDLAADTENAAAAENAFDAEVQRCVFHGQRYQLTLISEGVPLHTDRGFEETPPEVGARVRGRIAPSALHWLGDQGSGDTQIQS